MKLSTCDFDNKYENIKGIDDEGDIRKSCVFYTPDNEVTYMIEVYTLIVTCPLIIMKNAGWQYLEDMQEARSEASATVVEVIFCSCCKCCTC